MRAIICILLVLCITSFGCKKSCINCKCYKNNQLELEKEYCDYGDQDINAAERGLKGSGNYDYCDCIYK
jgi:hypothetical protein